MAKKTLFRAALFGGYNKEDVHEYIQTLENEIEAVKVLNQKEKNELQRQLDESWEQKAEEEEQLPRLKEELEHSRNRLREQEAELNRKLEEIEKSRETSENLEEELRKSREEEKRLQEELVRSGEELEKAREELAARPEDREQESAYRDGSAGESGAEEETGEEAEEKASVWKEKIRLSNENAELKARLESLKKEMSAMEQRLSAIQEEKDGDFFDYRTVTKIIEEAHKNAELIRDEAQKEGEQIIEKAVEDAEKQKDVIAARINMELEEKGIQLIAAKHKIDQYMKEVNSAQQGLFNIYTRMNQLIEKMPVRLDDYWDGEHYRALEKKREVQAGTAEEEAQGTGGDV